jgi:hypothetical protein
MLGLPFLAVILAVDGTATARPFDTVWDVAAFNRLMDGIQHPRNAGN